MLRRHFLMGASALALTGCLPESDDATKTVGDIIEMLKTNCGFITSVESLVPVILTLVTSFNAAAGAAATVAAAVAKQVYDLVCNAVKAESNQLKARAKATKAEPPKGAQEISVVVNGKVVNGTYSGG